MTSNITLHKLWHRFCHNKYVIGRMESSTRRNYRRRKLQRFEFWFGPADKPNIFSSIWKKKTNYVRFSLNPFEDYIFPLWNSVVLLTCTLLSRMDKLTPSVTFWFPISVYRNRYKYLLVVVNASLVNDVIGSFRRLTASSGYVLFASEEFTLSGNLESVRYSPAKP